MMLRRISAEALAARRRRSGVPRDLRRGRGRARRRADARRLAAHLVARSRWARNRTKSSPTSAPSSRSISRCRSTPAASACWPAITARRRSDLGVPLVGVGFMYPQGYFRQRISPEGWQQEVYERLNWDDAPITHARTRRRQAVRRARAARHPIGARPGVGGPARPRAAAPARHRPRAERAVGSRAVRAAVRRRTGHAPAAGDRAGPRRRAGAARARPDTRRCGT